MESKQRPLRLAIDMDGVTSHFVEGFQDLIAELFKVRLPAPSAAYPTSWNWYLTEANLDKGKDNYLWNTIRNSPSFWYDLTPLEGAEKALMLLEMWRAQGRVEPYFVTSRPGLTSHFQSVEWLVKHGVTRPQVLVVESANDKAAIVKTLGIDAFIDDRPENVIAVRDQIEEAQVFIMDRPYNRQMTDGRALRVGSLMEFFANVELA